MHAQVLRAWPTHSPTHSPTHLLRLQAEGARAFLLILPVAAPYAMRWARALLRTPGCVLLRAKDYTAVPIAFAQRLFSKGGAECRRLADSASKGRLVGLELAGEGCQQLVAERARGWNEQQKGATQAYAPAAGAEFAHATSTFFEVRSSPRARAAASRPAPRAPPHPHLRHSQFGHSPPLRSK